MKKRVSKKQLERLYNQYNDRCFVHPDPIEFVYQVGVQDREIVAFIASSLAYGRVQQILKSVSNVIERLESPLAAIQSESDTSLRKRLKGFQHRFTTGDELARLLIGIRHLLNEYGTLGHSFASEMYDEDDTVVGAATRFVARLSKAAGGALPFLLASPDKGSACKRFNLFLRWMVRKDEVDPGGWEGVPTSALIVPLDTHMHRIGLAFGFTNRKSTDMKTAMEITSGFRKFCKPDPVRYDFALTRAGILKNWGGDLGEEHQ